uniref:Mediator of RNA polymerase II transcription subunit 13 n=1 Tax=Tetranychus urticae TaxID=32264 RepID=T1K940_TETUR
MTHPNITNGASLEDCYTNFFALADLCGIKWKRLITPETWLPSATGDPLDDPVLKSFSKCLAAELLCVWRRVANNKSYSKELWIFWYGEEPDVSKLSPNELIEAEQGSWENGLSYECRTLLFKAFHNLIERCLLSRGFARIGKWFLQPFESDIPPDEGSSSSQLSFAFNFFVHGESTVCASVDVRVLPPVFRLARRNLLAAQGSSCGLNVILSPYGVAGIVTGQTFKDSDQSVQRLLQEWEKFYPLNLQSSKSGQSINGNNSNGSSSNNRQAPINVTPPFYVDCYDDVSVGVINDPISSASSLSLPSVVEVSVAGIKMKYPSSYIYIVPENYAKKTDDNSVKSTSRDAKFSQQQQSQQTQQPTPKPTQSQQQQTQQQTSNPTVNLLTPPNTPPELHQSYLAINTNRVRSQILSPIQPQIPSSTCRIRNNAFQEMNMSHQSSKPVEQNSTSSSTIAASSSPTTSPSSLSTTTATVTISTASTTASSPSISSANPTSTPNSNLGVTGVSGTSTPTPISSLTSSSTTIPTSATTTNTSNGITVGGSSATTTLVSGKGTIRISKFSFHLNFLICFNY